MNSQSFYYEINCNCVKYGISESLFFHHIVVSSVSSLTSQIGLEPVDFELVSLDETDFGHPVADVVSLITLQLEYLTVLRVLHYRPIAGKLLETNHGKIT